MAMMMMAEMSMQTTRERERERETTRCVTVPAIYGKSIALTLHD